MGNPLQLYKKNDTMTENMFDIICCVYAKSNKLLCRILYIFFVDCKMERISHEMDYLNKISGNPGQIRNYFLSLSGQMHMPIKIRYIRSVLNCSNKELREGLSNRYQILNISKSQMRKNKIDTKPIKFVSNVCKAVEDAGR